MRACRSIPESVYSMGAGGSFGFTPNPDGFRYRDLGFGNFLRGSPQSAPDPTRRPTPWCCRSTKRARSRRSIAPSPDCRLSRGAARPRRMTTSGTVPPPCLPRSACSTAPSSAAACSATTVSNSSAFSTLSSAWFAAVKSIHVVLGNYATHKHPKVLAWLARHRRRTFHFTPTSASWLNAVENFFSTMTRQRIRRGISARLSACRRQSVLILSNTMPTRNPSSGLNSPRRFWPNSTTALYHLFESVH
jgi:DDE superfamily endonuclease